MVEGNATALPFRNSLSGVQLVEQRLRLFQIERIEAFGELSVDWSEDREPPWVQLERSLGYYANSHSTIRR